SLSARAIWFQSPLHWGCVVHAARLSGLPSGRSFSPLFIGDVSFTSSCSDSRAFSASCFSPLLIGDVSFTFTAFACTPAHFLSCFSPLFIGDVSFTRRHRDRADDRRTRF